MIIMWECSERTQLYTKLSNSYPTQREHVIASYMNIYNDEEQININFAFYSLMGDAHPVQFSSVKTILLIIIIDVICC